MKKYLIALDLDGTLLDNNSLIPPKTNKYLQQLQKDGHKIVIATGRPYRGTINFYNELNLNTPMITESGALISPLNEKEFLEYSKTIDKVLVNNIINFIGDNLITAFFNIYDDLYTYNRLEELEFFYHLNEDSKIIPGPLNNKNYPEPHLILLGIKIEFNEQFQNYILNHTNNKLALRKWWEDDASVIYEIYLKNCSKGKSVLKIADYYNISKQNIISFGDGSNDLELLNDAGLGVKMINGSKRLTIYDDITTIDNHNEGVMHYLKDFLEKKNDWQIMSNRSFFLFNFF